MKILSIMIIDDSESDQFLTEMTIQKYNADIEIFQAYDGEEALQMLNDMDEQPGLILLDINMPRMNGFEFLEEYNKREKKSEIIAMLTSSDQGQDREKALDFPCVKTYFVKPIDTDDLNKLFKSSGA